MQTKYKLNHSLFIFGLMILFFIAAFPLVQAQTAAPGDLDTTFGSGGKVVTPVTEGGDEPTRVRIQPDGKIVTVGYNLNNGFAPPDSFLVRHNADGTVDNSFGTNGSVIVATSSSGEIIFKDFVILPDGKFLVTGERNIQSSATSVVIYRYTANGTLDATFVTNGVITTAINIYYSSQRIVLQPDGKFVVASENYIYNSGFSEVAVVRYNPDGTLDATFGTSGITRTSVGNSNSHFVGEILVQTDGKLLVAGHARFGINGDIFVLRYNPNGTLDTSFGANGIVQTDIDNLSNEIGGMALQSDGKIIVNGLNRLPSNYVMSSSIVRYNANGTLDNTFGTNGIVRIINPSQSFANIARALAIQQNGKILTAGNRNGTFAISRYNSDGTIDTSFGTNGVVITAIGNNLKYNVISSIALQTDGKIVAVGTANANDAGLGTAVGLVRYLGDAVTTTTRRTLFDFDGDGKADVSVFRPDNGVWYLQQSQAGFTGIQFGLPTHKLVPADYDGDGKTDVAVFRPSDGSWFMQRSSSQGFTSFPYFGAATDIPMPADFDGDGKSEVAVFRPSNGTWYVYNLANNAFNAIQFGTAGDVPVVADYDGDGKADYAVYRPSSGIWYLLQSTAGFAATQFGIAEDKPVVGDYDGDGRADIAVYRPSSGIWYLLRSSQGFTAFQFGIATDLPTPGDYDGDGKTDISVYRDGIWYMQNSTNGFSAIQFGLQGDKPIPNAFVP